MCTFLLINRLQLMKTIDTIKANENKAWFRSPFMPSSQDMDRAYSTGP